MEENEKLRWYNRIPRWLKIVLLVFSIITMVYWVSFMFFKMLKGFRIIGAFVFEERNYWTFLCCLLILAVGGLLMAQFAFGLDPFGKVADWLVGLFDKIRNAIASAIG